MTDRRFLLGCSSEPDGLSAESAAFLTVCWGPQQARRSERARRLGRAKSKGDAHLHRP